MVVAGGKNFDFDFMALVVLVDTSQTNSQVETRRGLIDILFLSNPIFRQASLMGVGLEELSEPDEGRAKLSTIDRLFESSRYTSLFRILGEV